MTKNQLNEATMASYINFISPRYWTQVYLGSDLWVPMSHKETLLRLKRCDSGWCRYKLNKTQLGDQRLCGNASGATRWPNLQLMEVVPPGAQIPGIQNYNQSLWHHLANNSSGATWWSNLELMQVAPPGHQLVAKFQTLPVAQGTQDIEFITWIIFSTISDLYSFQLQG